MFTKKRVRALDFCAKEDYNRFSTQICRVLIDNDKPGGVEMGLDERKRSVLCAVVDVYPYGGTGRIQCGAGESGNERFLGHCPE